MPMNKPHLEFHKIDMSKGWLTPPGRAARHSARSAAAVRDLAAQLAGNSAPAAPMTSAESASSTSSAGR